MVEVRASAKYVRVAPNKARQVIRHIKGLEIDEARRLLLFSPKDVARQIRKTLDSAVANAEHNNDLDPDDLVVTGAWVDEGPTLRRFQPRAMGRAYRIRKRTSHITITVGMPAAAAATAARGAGGRTRRPAATAPVQRDEDATAEAPEAATPGTAAEPEAATPDGTETQPQGEGPEERATAEPDPGAAENGTAGDDAERDKE